MQHSWHLSMRSPHRCSGFIIDHVYSPSARLPFGRVELQVRGWKHGSADRAHRPFRASQDLSLVRLLTNTRPVVPFAYLLGTDLSFNEGHSASRWPVCLTGPTWLWSMRSLNPRRGGTRCTHNMWPRLRRNRCRRLPRL